MILDYTNSKGQRTPIEVTEYEENCLDIRVGAAEVRIPIVGARYRLDAFCIMQDPNFKLGHYNERKQVRLKGELIKCVKRINTHKPGDYSKTHFILKNHICAIIEAMTSELLLHNNALGETQSDVLEDIDLTGKL